MTDAKPPVQFFDWATELSDAQGHVTLSEQEAHEIGARLRSMHAELETLRAGYDAARLEVESLHAQLEAIGAGGVEPLRGCAQAAPAAPAGEIVVTKNEQGQIVAVTRQDKEGRVLSIVAESSTPAEGDALDAEHVQQLREADEALMEQMQDALQEALELLDLLSPLEGDTTRKVRKAITAASARLDEKP